MDLLGSQLENYCEKKSPTSLTFVVNQFDKIYVMWCLSTFLRIVCRTINNIFVIFYPSFFSLFLLDFFCFVCFCFIHCFFLRISKYLQKLQHVIVNNLLIIFFPLVYLANKWGYDNKLWQLITS